MSHTRAPRDGGFTLIEVMIAILLTAIAVIGIIALFMTQSRASSFSRHSTEATSLATDKLEKLRTTATPLAGSDTDLTAIGAANGMYDRTWTVTSITPTGQTTVQYIDLVVTVSWDEDGVAKQVVLRGRRGV